MEKTPLFYCSSPQVTQMLLDNGAQVDHTDEVSVLFIDNLVYDMMIEHVNYVYIIIIDVKFNIMAYFVERFWLMNS